MYDYYKGCSMFRMIENVLTKNTMDKAMRNLIQKYQYSNFDEDDLLAEFQSAATEDNIQLFEHQGSIDRVFKSWFHKPNYPIKNETHLWDIPLNFATSKEPNFEETTAEYILPKVPILTIRANGKFMLDQNEWIIMNKQQTGLYVVNYDQHNWEVIAEALAYSHESIHYLNRAQIVRDVMVLHANNYLSLEIAFDVLSYLSQETDLTVWRSAINTLMYFNTVLEDGKAEEKFKEFVREIIKEIVEIVKIQDSDPEEKAFISDTRISLLELACEVDHPG
uniref:ERAP1-like C-terminal domain-containing protein n=1 Tax=Megaselia scalaris TaxID=36166 RepID=T1GET9_MEGSC